MSDSMRFDRLLSDWLETDGPTAISEGLVEAALVDAHTRRQSRDWLRRLGLQLRAGQNARRRRMGAVTVAILVVLSIVAGALYLAGARRADVHRPLSNGLLAYPTFTSIVSIDPPTTLAPAEYASSTNVSVLDAPSWSPDGHHLAYWSSVVDHPTEIEILDTRSEPDPPASLTLLSAPPDHLLAWAPDGSAFAVPDYDRFSGASMGYIKVSPLNGVIRLLPIGVHRFAGGVAWSPDGSRIAFRTGSLEREGALDLDVMHPDGSGLRTVASGGAESDIGMPQWTTDGSELVVSWPSAPGAQHDILAIDADTGTVRTISRDPRDELFPVISHDGRRIAWQVGNGSTTTIVVANLDGSNPVQVTATTDPVGTGPMIWSPDDHSIVTLACRSASDCDHSFLILPVDPDGIRLEQPTANVADDGPRLQFSWQVR